MPWVLLPGVFAQSHPRRGGLWPVFLAGLFVGAGPAGAALAGPLPAYAPAKFVPPEPAREFRGAWVASVANIDWPSKPGLPVEQQKGELLALLDRARQIGLNAIILQVRPAADALYRSDLEPWSEYLTGEMGRAPEPFYDPLAFAVAEAHARGLELHAWLNPFRARHPSAKSPIAANHVSRAKPALVKTYGRHLWLDPGEAAARDHSLKVVRDLARRYAVDGLHLDDYFYPYQEKDAAGQRIDFPDDDSWGRYQKAGGKLGRADWRRENINLFLADLYRAVKAEKPWVKVGLSPFGIWRPGAPQGITGLDPYEQLYADSRKWLASGWLDYFAPQLYWSIESRGQSFPVLLKWWEEQNTKKRHIWPGLNTRKLGDGWEATEILRQIELCRQSGVSSGHLHWSIQPLLKNQGGVAEALRKGPYAQPALAPGSPWLGKTAPPAPRIFRGGNPSTGLLSFSWEAAGKEGPAFWLLQWRREGPWQTEIRGPDQRAAYFAPGKYPELVALRAVSKYGLIGPPATLEKK